MQEKDIIIWLNIMRLISAMLIFGWIMMLGIRRPKQVLLRAYEEFKGYLAARNRNSEWYQRTEEWLCKNGAAFHFGKWLHPVTWMMTKILSASIGFIIGIQFSWWGGIFCAIILYLLPNILVRYLNYKDNEKLLPELKLIYHGLEIQIRAGVYVTDALTECYAGVQEIRLRQALLDLAGAVTVKADVYDALNHMQSCFDNNYIDALCITLIQAMESGQAVELLSDIAEQVKDMEVTVMERKKGALDRSITFYQLGILAALLGIVLYACVTQMFTAALNF